MKYLSILLLSIVLTSCTTIPADPDQMQQQHNDMDKYMLSHGHMVYKN